MAGLRTLDPPMEVRVLLPQPLIHPPLSEANLFEIYKTETENPQN